MVNNHAPLLRSIAKTEQDKAQIELAKSRNEATNILVGKSVNEYVGRQLDMATSNLINPNNENFANMVNLIEKGNRSGSLSPDEQGQVRVAMNQYRTKVTEEVMAGLRREYGGDLTGKMMEDAKQTITDHMSIYENALTNKDYGLLNYTIHALEDQKTNDSLSLTKSPFIRLNAALTGLLGPQASEMVMQWGSGLAQGRDKALFANELTGLLTGKDGKSVFNTISASKDKIGDVGKFTEAMVNAHVAVLNNQATTPEALKNAAKSLYGEENAPFLRSIKSDKQEMVFNRLVNNTVFQRMKQARDNGDAETYNNYVGWTKNAFPVLFRKAADTLSKTTRQQEISVQFSTETNQFKVMSPDPNSPALNGISRGLYGESYTVVSRAVDRMNSSIRGILPILKEEGTEPMSFLGNAFQNLGMDTEGNLLGQARSQLMKGSVMKLGGAEFTPEEMAIQLPPGKELQMKDPTSGQMVSRFRPGDSATIILPRTDIGLGEAPINVRQMTPEQGDAVQLDELNSMATRKKQDLLLLQQMAKENPEDTGIRDQLDKVITDYTDLVKEIHIINNAWVEQFSKKK